MVQKLGAAPVRVLIVEDNRDICANIAAYLETGFTPDYDSVGGSMVEVQKNMAELTAADREAIAAYLKAIPAVQ